MDPFIGEIRAFPYTFAPRDWAECNGQLLDIASHTALFAVIGTTYGGDGHSNFALPDLRGRVAPGMGRGSGLSDWRLGETAGQNEVPLLEQQMPPHNHTLQGLNSNGNESSPGAQSYLAQDNRQGQGVVPYLAPAGADLDDTMADQAMASAGAGHPHENRQPFLTLRFCIALDGLFPSRS